jgi:hypothetical protein
VQTTGGAGSGFLPATTVDEFVDDALSRLTIHGPAADVAAAILTAARSGPAAAAAAVREAEALCADDQFTTWTALCRLVSDLPEAAPVARQIKTEWRRLCLPERQAAWTARPEGRHVATDAAPGDRFSPGVPDYMKLRR